MALKSHVVTTEQAATILGVSSSTVSRYREQGKLRGFPGRITKASIEEHLGEPVQWPDEDDPNVPEFKRPVSLDQAIQEMRGEATDDE